MKKIEKIKAQRSEAVKSNLSVIEERQIKRKEFYEETKKRVKLLKNTTYFYKICESEDEKKRIQDLENAKKIFQRNSRENLINFEQLREN